MAQRARAQASAAERAWLSMRPPSGTVRTCAPYRGEIARHRVISADGHDYVVATLHESQRGSTYLTGAYPVARGYLVMVRQPLYETHSRTTEEAHGQHEQLVQALAEAGVRIVRARRALAARLRAETREAALGGAPSADSETGQTLVALPLARAVMADLESMPLA